MRNVQVLTAAGVAAIFFLQFLMLLLPKDYFPFCRFPMYAGRLYAEGFSLAELCLSKEELGLSAEFGLSCLPFGFEFNKVRTSTLPRWHQMYRLGQSEARLDDRRFYKVWRTTVRSVESSQIKLPVYASVWLRKWSQIDSKNWRQPDTVELLYQGKIDGPQL